jgi:hypothetical protein
MKIGEPIKHRYREFALVSEQDEVLRRAFRDGFKRAGLSFEQFLDAASPPSESKGNGTGRNKRDSRRRPSNRRGPRHW